MAPLAPATEALAYEVDTPADDYDAREIGIEVYLTRGGKLLLTAETSGDWGKNVVSGPAVTHWGKYDSLAELARDELMEQLRRADSAELLDEVSKQLGDDWATWID